MLNFKPIININPSGFTTDICNNYVGNIDNYGNFKSLCGSYPTAKVDMFGYLRDNVTNNVIAEVRGVLPRTDLYTHKPYDHKYSFNSPELDRNKSDDYLDNFKFPKLKSSKNHNYMDSFNSFPNKTNKFYGI